MSYNTELQSNNAELQEILDAVNDLPDAGGGGGGGGVQYATGTLTLNTGVKSSDTTFVTIDSLPFKPVYVIVTSSESSFRMSSTNYYGLVSLEGGLVTRGTFARKTSTTYTYVYSTTSYAALTITDTGFTIKSTSDYLYTGAGYSYMAFGGEFTNAGTYDFEGRTDVPSDY